MQRYIPYFAMTLQTMLIGPAFTIASWAAHEIDSLVLYLFRCVGAACVFLLYFAVRRGDFRRIDWRKHGMKILALALIGTLMNQLLYILGVTYTTPGTVALIYSLTPLVVLLLAVWRGTERLTGLKLLGVVLAIVGVVLVVGFQGAATPARFPLLGNLFALVALGCWCFYLVYSGDVVQEYGPMQVTGLLMVIAAVVYLPVGLWRLPEVDLAPVSGQAWFGVGYMIAVNSSASYFLILFAIRRIKPSQVAIFMNIQPAVAMAFSVAWGQEALTMTFLLGAGLSLLGIYLLNLSVLRRAETG